jgi:hypothetical protein
MEAEEGLDTEKTMRTWIPREAEEERAKAKHMLASIENTAQRLREKLGKIDAAMQIYSEILEGLDGDRAHGQDLTSQASGKCPVIPSYRFPPNGLSQLTQRTRSALDLDLEMKMEMSVWYIKSRVSHHCQFVVFVVVADACRRSSWHG